MEIRALLAQGLGLLALTASCSELDAPHRVPREISGYAEIDTYPEKALTRWSHRGQGLAHDEGEGVWYFTSVDRVFKVPVTADLASAEAVKSAGIPYDGDCDRDEAWCGCNHYGDPDFFQGRLVVPLQGCARGRRYVLFDTNLSIVGWKDVRPGDVGCCDDTAAWAAIDPRSGRLYTSPFDNPDRVYVYELLDTRAPGFVDHAYTIQLDRALHHVQGGDVSESGHLYLAADGTHEQRGHQLAVFSVDGARAESRMTIRFAKEYGQIGPWNHGDEVEGIDLWDLRQASRRHPSLSKGGQVHVMVTNSDLTGWKYSLKHFEVDR